MVRPGSTGAPAAAAAAAAEAASEAAFAAVQEQGSLSWGDVGADDTGGRCPALVSGCSTPGGSKVSSKEMAKPDPQHHKVLHCSSIQYDAEELWDLIVSLIKALCWQQPCSINPTVA